MHESLGHHTTGFAAGSMEAHGNGERRKDWENSWGFGFGIKVNALFAHPRPLLIINTNDLVDPSNERGYLHVNAGHIDPSAAESPGHQTGQLVEAIVLANERSTAITLARIVTLFTAGTKAGCRKDEDLLRHGVHLANALGIAHDRDLGLTDPQRNRTRLAHISVSRHGTALASGMADTSRR